MNNTYWEYCINNVGFLNTLFVLYLVFLSKSIELIHFPWSFFLKIASFVILSHLLQVITKESLLTAQVRYPLQNFRVTQMPITSIEY